MQALRRVEVAGLSDEWGRIKCYLRWTDTRKPYSQVVYDVIGEAITDCRTANEEIGSGEWLTRMWGADLA